MVSARGLEHHEFPDLQAFGRIESRREADGKVQTETRHFALSWMPAPEVFMATVRAHWAIENALHWQLDVSFREDAARNRKDNGPANIAMPHAAAPSTSPDATPPRARSRSNRSAPVGTMRFFQAFSIS